MYDKLATLSLIQLKELAKAQGIKNVSSMRKPQLVELLVELGEKSTQEKPEVKDTEICRCKRIC